MSRDELVDVTYRAELALNSFKARYGVITKKQSNETRERLYTAMDLVEKIDNIVAAGGDDRERQLAKLKEKVDYVNMSRAGGKQELELPMAPVKIRPLGALRSLLHR